MFCFCYRWHVGDAGGVWVQNLFGVDLTGPLVRTFFGIIVVRALCVYNETIFRRTTGGIFLFLFLISLVGFIS